MFGTSSDLRHDTGPAEAAAASDPFDPVVQPNRML
jgi:hypothetical protein